MKLFLIRHGESKGNEDVNVYKEIRNCDIELSNKGRKESVRVAKLINRAFGVDFGLKKTMFTSTYRRAVDTATLISKNLDFKISNTFEDILLEEQNYGIATGYSSLKDFCAAYDLNNTSGFCASECNTYKDAGEINYIIPRGESLRDVYVRCGLFVERHQWFSNMGTVMIVAHKGVCNMLEAYLCGTKPKLSDWKNAEVRMYYVDHISHTATKSDD